MLTTWNRQSNGSKTETTLILCGYSRELANLMTKNRQTDKDGIQTLRPLYPITTITEAATAYRGHPTAAEL